MANRRSIRAQMVSNTKISGALCTPDILEVKKIVDINRNVCHISKALNAKGCVKQAQMRVWLSGRASPCQGECRGFESHHPLK